MFFVVSPGIGAHLPSASRAARSATLTVDVCAITDRGVGVDCRMCRVARREELLGTTVCRH